MTAPVFGVLPDAGIVDLGLAGRGVGCPQPHFDRHGKAKPGGPAHRWSVNGEIHLYCDSCARSRLPVSASIPRPHELVIVNGERLRVLAVADDGTVTLRQGYGAAAATVTRQLPALTWDPIASLWRDRKAYR